MRSHPIDDHDSARFHDEVDVAIAGHHAGDRALEQLLSGLDSRPEEWPEAWRTYERKAFPRFAESRDELPAAHEDATWSGRVSTRRFSPDKQIAPESMSEILTPARLHHSHGRDGTPNRAVPSAGALFPVECYWITPQAVSYYDGDDHALVRLWPAPTELFAAPERVLGTTRCRGAAGYLVLTGVLYRNMRKYGARGYRYALLEAGALLQEMTEHARRLGVASVWLGGFDDERLAELIGVRSRLDLEVPLIVAALGYAET